MPPRADWKAFLKLSLVSRSIALVQAASSRERIHFNIINRETANRNRYRQVDAQTGENVPQADWGKGYQAADGSYVLRKPEEFDEIRLDTRYCPFRDARSAASAWERDAARTERLKRAS